MPVGPIHHRCDGKPPIAWIIVFFFNFSHLSAFLHTPNDRRFAPISPIFTYFSPSSTTMLYRDSSSKRHLAAIFAIARPAWGYPLDQAAMKDAFVVAKRLGVTSKSRSRERRPTLEELDLLMIYFGERQKRRPSSVPMQKVIAFAIFSTRRLDEITRLHQTDLDNEGSSILVRDMKSPGEKTGNDVWCDLPAEALRIVHSMPSSTEEIFPFTTDAIGMGFTRACQVLGIKDLHFHDLRHDGVSRLFEVGRNIPQVATVSGHRSWSSLKRYTHLRQTGDKYADWKFSSQS